MVKIFEHISFININQCLLLMFLVAFLSNSHDYLSKQRKITHFKLMKSVYSDVIKNIHFKNE